VQERFSFSERRVCRLLNLHRKTIRYRCKAKNDEHLLNRLKHFAAKRRRWGYRRLDVLLRREGIIANHKRVFRVYSAAKLQVRRRKKTRVAIARGLEPPKATHLNEYWAMDFVHDTIGKRSVRYLTVVDLYNRESPMIYADFSIPSRCVARKLERVGFERGALPATIIVDNGPEFSSRHILQWAAEHGIELHFIVPGKPTQNCYIESFNRSFRDECLNEHSFTSLAESRDIVEAWRKDYNAVRPHTSLGKRTPLEFAKLAVTPHFALVT